MIGNKHDVIAATLAYAALFDYPLTENEIIEWLIFSPDQQVSERDLKQFPELDGYYTLSARRLGKMVAARKQKQQWAAKKWHIAHRATQLLRIIPSVLLIGVSGGLALDNAEEDDDIDLFFVVAPGTIWISRLLVLFVLECLGSRRRRTDIIEKDKLCPNMFLTVDQLSLPQPFQDIYTAHEVLQMIPIFERQHSYQNFLAANIWVKRFLPKAWERRRNAYQVSSFRYQDSILRVFEPVAKHVQQRIMKPYQTTEVTTDTRLQFHPHDLRKIIKKRFNIALKQFNIPLTENFQ